MSSETLCGPRLSAVSLPASLLSSSFLLYLQHHYSVCLPSYYYVDSIYSLYYGAESHVHFDLSTA